MKRKIHAIGAIITMLCIASFFTSTLIVELFGSKESVLTIKSLVVNPGLFILIPAIAAAGITGFILAKNRKGTLVTNKKKRMPIIAANGLLVLTPCAIFLNQWAESGTFDTRFYLVQSLELLAGAVNLVLMRINLKDGLRMTGKLRVHHPHLSQ
ncbi:hypothetical protein EYS14_00520 [Alteromonadaceae bacterium M269]|nr:hypothetical protein EYS14_00520 [Alteromonadaceae bacterium M269]